MKKKIKIVAKLWENNVMNISLIICLEHFENIT